MESMAFVVSWILSVFFLLMDLQCCVLLLFFDSIGSLERVSKRFGGDFKLPTSKLKLIPDDDNCGGFPNLKKPDSKQSFGLSDEDDIGSNGMRTVGLVASSMGLETMPVVYQEKPRKALDSEMGGNGKIDSRPQKIHKTGGFMERQPVNAARFSSDAFQFNKSMLAGSKKQHHKLPTPVKSPRTLPRRSTVRLVEPATKILDSGSHARNRALTYIGSSRAGGVQGANAGSFSRNSKDSPILKQMLVSKPDPKPRNLRQNPLPMAKDKAPMRQEIKKLTSLDMDECFNILEAPSSLLEQEIKELTSLDMDECFNTLEAALQHTTPLRGDAPSSLLEQEIKELTSLDMDECFNILEAPSSLLEQEIKELTSLDMDECFNRLEAVLQHTTPLSQAVY